MGSSVGECSASGFKNKSYSALRAVVIPVQPSVCSKLHWWGIMDCLLKICCLLHQASLWCAEDSGLLASYCTPALPEYLLLVLASQREDMSQHAFGFDKWRVCQCHCQRFKEVINWSYYFVLRSLYIWSPYKRVSLTKRVVGELCASMHLAAWWCTVPELVRMYTGLPCRFCKQEVVGHKISCVAQALELWHWSFEVFEWSEAQSNSD